MAGDPSAYVSKLAKCIRLLGSSETNEIAAAIRALKRTLESAGEDFSDLGDRVENSGGQTVSEEDLQRLYDAGFNACARQVEAQRHGDRAFRELAVAELSRNEEMVRFCWERQEQLRDRELGFIEGMTVIVGNGDEPSPKQIAWLISIHRRLGGR